MSTTFQDIWVRWPWRPIRNCPGRFVLSWPDEPISLETLLGFSPIPQVFPNSAAKDSVLVIRLEEGGVISYEQLDGRLIHTLNTPEGFSRKLRQLGITLEGSTQDLN